MSVLDNPLTAALQQVVRSRGKINASSKQEGSGQEGPLRLLPLRGTGELRQRDSKSLRPLRADRADAITCARNGMLEYWNADVLGFRTSIHYSILPIFNLSGLNFQQLAE
jgi:hypothetical protein